VAVVAADTRTATTIAIVVHECLFNMIISLESGSFGFRTRNRQTQHGGPLSHVQYAEELIACSHPFRACGLERTCSPPA
jgi:hypothetical protein